MLLRATAFALRRPACSSSFLSADTGVLETADTKVVNWWWPEQSHSLENNFKIRFLMMMLKSIMPHEPIHTWLDLGEGSLTLQALVNAPVPSRPLSTVPSEETL